MARRRSARGSRVAGGERKQAPAAATRLTEDGEQALTRLQDAESAYRDLYENIPDMVVSADALAILADCNHSAAEALGLSSDRLIGTALADLYHPQCRKRAVRVYAAVVSTGVSRQAEFDIRRQDGRTIAVVAHVSAVRDRRGQVVGSRSVLRDVTARRRVEDALRASRARYESLYADAPDMFASVDVETGRIVQCNRTLLRATGQTRDAIMGRTLRDLHEAACWETLAHALQRLRDEDHVRDVELRLHGTGASVLEVSLSLAAIRDEEDNLYYRCTWRDITARRRAQDALHQKQRELERSQAELRALTARLMTAQDDERRRISRELHDDVNQRLALLALEIDTLERDLPGSTAETVARLAALRERVVSLSDDVHRLAYQFHPSILDDLGLPTALEALADDFRRREGIEVDLALTVLNRIPPEVAYCCYRVTQESLRNIAAHAHADRVALTLQATDGGIGLVIEDFGVGFEPGGDANRPGLGVVGMQERVRLVGGRFQLVSRVGEGTRIDIWVPAAGAAS